MATVAGRFCLLSGARRVHRRRDPLRLFQTPRVRAFRSTSRHVARPPRRTARWRNRAVSLKMRSEAWRASNRELDCGALSPFPRTVDLVVVLKGRTAYPRWGDLRSVFGSDATTGTLHPWRAWDF